VVDSFSPRICFSVQLKCQSEKRKLIENPRDHDNPEGVAWVAGGGERNCQRTHNWDEKPEKVVK
jgi:hypothetical protein